ncbi:MAG: 1-hydroxycarotenoid 3,4-desaturase CrtD [Sedimentitalea sp.]
MPSQPKAIVIGAGIGGLAAALRLAHAGLDVTVLERHSHVGGKIRAFDSVAGPVDAGPTVLTLRAVFEQLFADVGETLSDHVRLEPLQVLARHFWPDGTQLDLSADTNISATNIAHAFGEASASDYRKFAASIAQLFAAFDGPMMQAAQPRQSDLTRVVMRNPSLIKAMAPHRTLAQHLRQQFGDARLAQLYGRYATYVGGSPFQSPALLGLIAHAEAAGVWQVPGGLTRLPKAIARLAQQRGARVICDTDVTDVSGSNGDFTVTTPDRQYRADLVVFNGDPRALSTGTLGAMPKSAVPPQGVEPRSLSACVLAFAARVTGPSLSHHNVFFGETLRGEFDALAAGHIPEDATLYLCAQDRSGPRSTEQPERFELIMNAPPGANPTDQEKQQCLTQIFRRLALFGLTFDPVPGLNALTTPTEFHHLFPASQGALYGRSPHGMTAALKRPTARSKVAGLYLVGGGAHPGAGVPMATLSARHAAEAILNDLPLTSTWRPTAMPGGTLTGSATTEPKPSRLSVS